MFEKIKHYYEMGLYKQSHIEKLLKANAISQDEYMELRASKDTE